MVPTHSWPSRLVLALLALQFASACNPPTTPPSGNTDTAPPSTRANPLGGNFTASVTVTLTCDDGMGSGCAATYYTTDGSQPSASSPRYTNPVALSQSTTLKFFSVDTAGNAEAHQTQNYVVDVQPPTTVASPAGGIINSARSVALLCSDPEGSGCAATYYTTDGSTPTTGSPRYSAPLSISATTTLRFFSVDQVGNTEAVRTERYTLDTAAPTVTASLASGNYNTPQTVTLSCNDGLGSGCDAIHYTTDGSVPSASSPAYSTPLALNTTTLLRFFATDLAGNASPVVTMEYIIDPAGPATAATPPGGIYNKTQSVALTCDDGAGSGCAAIYYTLDGTPPTTGSTRYTAAILITASTTLRFYSVDKAGNAGPTVTEQYTLDFTAPVTSASPRGGNHAGALDVTLGCSDGTGSGCAATYYTTDGSVPTRSSARYTGPLHLVVNTTLRFFSEDKAGNLESARTEVYNLDAEAPRTTATPAGGLYNANQNVVLTCGDGVGSGCTATHYTFDGSTPTTGSPRYTGPILLTGNTTLKFFSVDAANNAEPVRTETYVIDTVPPTTTAAPKPGIYGNTQSVTLACDDGTGSGCNETRYTTDGTAPTSSSPLYTGPISIAATATLRYFSTDKAGNKEPVHVGLYTIDKVAPTVSATPAGGLYRTAQSVTLTCADDTGGAGCSAIHYTTDGSAPTTGSATYGTPLSITATTTLKFLAVDKVGNVSGARSETYTLDEVAPTTTAIKSGGAYPDTQTVSLVCNDGSGSGCVATYFTLDGSTPSSTPSSKYTAPFSISANTTLKFFSVDAAGNEESTRTETYIIDRVKPTVAASPTGGISASARSVTLTCTDEAGGSGCDSIHYTTDGSTPTTSSAAYTSALTVSANTTLKFLAVDNAGNESSIQTETYVIDPVAPTTTASPMGGTYRSSQTITLTCSDGTGTGCADTYYTTDGSAPTTGSPRYTGPFSLSSTTTLKFFSVDKAGNAEAVRTETYTFELDTVPPTTSASPVGGTYDSAQTITLACSDDAGGSGCEATYYTLDGSTPTPASARYTGPFSLSSNTTLRFFSVDKAGNTEAARTETYSFGPSPADISAQIASVRAQLDGPISTVIDSALVTYTKPLTGTATNDPAGFFLQAEKNGPAIFVAIDPFMLTPPLQVGDRVYLRATEKKTVNGLVQVSQVDPSSFFLLSEGTPVEFLRNDVSTVDLAANYGADHESELISISGTVAGPFAPGGTGNVSAYFVTVGNPITHNNLRLRMTTTLQDSLDVAQNCSITVRSPLWRFVNGGTTQAQPSVWAAEDISVLSCPAPKVVSALPATPTQLVVTFDRRIDPASVLANGSQFTFTNGLSASAATVSGREVRLTTVFQSSGTSYQVTAATSLKDTYGKALDSTATTATFIGYQTTAVLLLNEVNPSLSGGRDLIELLAVSGGSVNQITVVADGSPAQVLATLPNVTVAAGDIIVVHLAPSATFDAPASETLGKSEFPKAMYGTNYDTAWDFRGGSTGLSFANRVLRVKDALGNTQDAVPFVATIGTPSSIFLGQLQAIQAEGLWLPADCTGALCTYDTYPTAVDVSVNWTLIGSSSTSATSVQRLGGGFDTNMYSDWYSPGTSSFGLPNP
ncbi:hypothetical protein BO221_24495 [Archangium sp. Cb G35]|uniref:chitobiase/beta-hexosaminidase C-terminal domain-containing protein n=1 Tax=Archangium sp. Cb G35 TaxID=1920190 RepID=UPI000935788A|nr:chitobiase/beta-hexosaminidase C-terminal domain-containing protein [Archangium sp. Cb G35]OJT21916.1 hypothetical protein BO221_24495 [Archangium sp. Cb G35]